MKKLLFSTGVFIGLCNLAQAQKTPAVTLMQAKEKMAVVKEINQGGGFYTNNKDSASTILFEYNYTAAQNDGISDDEYKEIIGFNIVPDQSGKFILTSKDLSAANTYFYKSCFCADRGTYAAVSGTIKGTKMSKTTWYVNMNIKVNTSKNETPVWVTKKVKGFFNIVSQ